VLHLPCFAPMRLAPLTLWSLSAWLLLPAAPTSQGEEAGRFLHRGLRRAQMLQHPVGRAAGSAAAAASSSEAAAGWEAALKLYERGLAAFGSPALPWDATMDAGPQLLLEAARALLHLRRYPAALARLRQLESSLPRLRGNITAGGGGHPATSVMGEGGKEAEAGTSARLHAMVHQWAFRCHRAAGDYRGAAVRAARLLGLEDWEAVETAIGARDLFGRHSTWQRVALPAETQVRVAAPALMLCTCARQPAACPGRRRCCEKGRGRGGAGLSWCTLRNHVARRWCMARPAAARCRGAVARPHHAPAAGGAAVAAPAALGRAAAREVGALSLWGSRRTPPPPSPVSAPHTHLAPPASPSPPASPRLSGKHSMVGWLPWLLGGEPSVVGVHARVQRGEEGALGRGGGGGGARALGALPDVALALRGAPREGALFFFNLFCGAGGGGRVSLVVCLGRADFQCLAAMPWLPAAAAAAAPLLRRLLTTAAVARQSPRAQQHRAVCGASLAQLWARLVANDPHGGGGARASWLSPYQFPLAFDPTLADPAAEGGWLNESDAALGACAALTRHRAQILREWREYALAWPEGAAAEKEQRGGGRADGLRMTARHAVSRAFPSYTWGFHSG
jgi:hypothetical protein